MHIFHKWSKWEDRAGFVTNLLTDARRNCLVQTRTCSSCGKREVRAL